MKDYQLDTLCIHAGYQPKNGEPRVAPIVQSTTYVYESSKEMGALFDLQEDGFFYTRLANPTNDVVEKKIAALEGGVGALLTSSGQAANLMAVLNICPAGSHVVSSSAIYGGTFNLFYKTMKEMGIETTFVSPAATAEELRAAMRPNTRAVFAETLANPSLAVADLEVFAQAAHEQGVPLIVDNTFPTPINCRPIEFGADIVTHSTTKYMDGHAVPPSSSARTSSPTPPPSTWTATLSRWAASLWIPAISTGITASSPCSPSRTSPITAWCTPSSLARRLTSPRPAPT